MSHERIVASAIYYYDTSPGLDGAGLMFRRRITDDEQYRMETDEPLVGGLRTMGTVPTPPGRLLVFHNSRTSHMLTSYCANVPDIVLLWCSAAQGCSADELVARGGGAQDPVLLPRR